MNHNRKIDNAAAQDFAAIVAKQSYGEHVRVCELPREP